MSKPFTCSFLMLCSWVLSACDGGTTVAGHSHSQSAHSHGVFEVEPGVWPPTLTNITNQQLISNSRRTRGSEIVVASARNSVMNNPAVRAALGDNFAEMEASAGDVKSGLVASFLFYNYQTDQTIDTALLNNGSITQNVYSASNYQPAENANEVQTAIRLATNTMHESGVELTGLQGTAMLAHPAIDNSENRLNNLFHSQRLMYVTFGEGDGVQPMYRALVNLSRSAVIEHGLIQQ